MSEKLLKITTSECLDEIRKYTGDFSKIGGNVDDLFIDELKVKLSPKDAEIFRGEINAPRDIIITKKVIGRGGYYFHLTTRNAGVHFIWHDRANEKFIIWGEDYNVRQALGILNYRIKIVTQREKDVINNV